MNKVGYNVSNSGTITVVINGKSHSVAFDHPNYAQIVDALKNQEFENIEALINIGVGVVKHFNNTINIEHGQIVFNGTIIQNGLTERILMLVEKNLPFKPMIKFFENLLDNPSKRAVDELYTFLEVNQLPITEDGHFLAYKRVNDNFKDFHTGTIDNSAGQVVKIIRNLVCDDKEKTCSYGLHFCSKAYLKEFHNGEGKIIVLKIDPKNVVSIPVDYQNSKGRTCAYEVVGEITNDIDVTTEEEYFDSPVYSSDGQTAYHNVRDSKGRFIKSDAVDQVNGRDSKGRFVKKT